MEFIIALASIAAVVWIVRKSITEAFLDIYLPIVLCIPAWPRLVLPGVPDPTFQEAAILPITITFLWQMRRRLRFSRFDLLIASFVLIQGISELVNAGYDKAQNLMFDVLFNGFFPYLVAKNLLCGFQLRVRFLKRFVTCVAFVVITCLYEAKFGYSLYKLLFDSIFSSEGDVWVTTFRYGFARVAGPYGHAILAGIIFLIAIRMQSWLSRAKQWAPKNKYSLFPKITKSKALSFSTLLGLILTWVRGPQIGAIIAWLLSLASRGKDPQRRIKIATIVFLVVGIPLAIWGFVYASVGRAAAATAGQESAAYRKELIDLYIVIARQHLWIGWGRNGWPQVPFMPSIDNYYLLITLMHGIIALAILLAILAIVSVRLYRYGLKFLKKDLLLSSMSFEMLSIFVGFSFAIGTVYIGEAVFPIFFMLLGFSEALLTDKGKTTGTVDRSQKPILQRQRLELRPLRFKRVVT